MTNQTTFEGLLLAPYRFAEMLLQYRVAMASMTCGRAKNAALIPTELHVDYYRQRASAGLIMTEATWISREAIGSINVPGLFTEEQTIAWRAATDAGTMPAAGSSRSLPIRARSSIRISSTGGCRWRRRPSIRVAVIHVPASRRRSHPAR